MMDGYDGGVGWTAWFAMAIMMVVFWGLVIVAVVLVARSLGRDRTPPETSKTSDTSVEEPLRILDGRLARGEIDVDEFQRLRDALLRRTHEPS